MKITRERLKYFLNNAEGKKIAVIGDVMLDKYVYGDINRISPEAPVPVVDIQKTEYKLGGAANVAHNIKALGAEPLLIGVIGNDHDSSHYLSVMQDMGLVTAGIIRDKSRSTTTKTRVIVSSQHVLRIDHELKSDIDAGTQNKILEVFKKNLNNITSVVLQDYNKGVLSVNLIKNILAICRKSRKPVYVDPKFQNFFEYRGVTVFKPNRKETGDVLGIKVDGDKSAASAGKEIIRRIKCKYLILTRGDKGMMLFRKSNGRVLIKNMPTKARHVADVSGAGDTVISTIAVMLAGGAVIEEAAEIANHAAGIVCGEVGIIPIYRKSLIESFSE